MKPVSIERSDSDFSRSQYDVVAVAAHSSRGLSVRTQHLREPWPAAKRFGLFRRPRGLSRTGDSRALNVTIRRVPSSFVLPAEMLHLSF
jgi:hypothetical protein